MVAGVLTCELGTCRDLFTRGPAEPRRVIQVVAGARQVARLVADPLRHLRLRHGRKRLIEARLPAEGCPLE